MKLSFYDQSDGVQSVSKTKYDNDMIEWAIMTDQIECGMWQKLNKTKIWLIVQVWFYIENETKLSWYITLGTVYD